MMRDRGPDPIDVEVGSTLRRFRRRLKMSQEQLGLALGITFQQIQKYERGTNRISASMIVKAAKCLGVQPADLLPTTDALTSPPLFSQTPVVRGSNEVAELYVDLRPGQRRVILSLLRAMVEDARHGSLDEDDGSALATLERPL